MNFEKMKKGTELIKLPDYYHHNFPFKIYFLFLTEDYGKKGYAQIVVTTKIDICNKYNSISELRKDGDIVFFNPDIIFIIDLTEIKKHSEYLLKVYNSFDCFIKKNMKVFNAVMKWAYPFQGENYSMLNSFYIRTIKVCPFIFRIRFIITNIINIIIGAIKYLLFIPIFVFDIFKYSFRNYINYKKEKNEYENLKKYAYVIAYPDTSEIKKQEIIEEARKKLDIVKVEYLNSNNVLLTLLISIVGIIIALWISYKQIENISMKNEILMKTNNENTIEIEKLNHEIINLKIIDNKMNITKLKDEEQRLNSIIEVNNKLLKEKIDELEKKIQIEE